MSKNLIYICFISLCLFAVSCAPSTPAARIAERPMAFEKLSDGEKKLVQHGEIEKGMGMSAVDLAWGEPSNRVEGFNGTKRMERWDYNDTQPVVTNRLYGGYRYGCDGPYRYSGVSARIGPEIVYVPYRKGSVWFIGGKVTEWERLK